MEGLQTATFAAGCFWGVQHYFDQVPGVITTRVGFTGGRVANPTYEQVCKQETGHAEAIDIEFDPSLVAYETLVKHFFRMHDPTQKNRQGPDVGENYRSAIFYHDESQKRIAQNVQQNVQPRFKKPIVTSIEAAKEFYPAEDFHQKFSERTGRGGCHIGYTPLG